MKIALLGYGKMGKVIEGIAKNRGHEIVYIADSTPNPEELKKAEVAIDFSIPTSAFENISMCLENNVKVVSGTTGWLEKYDDAVKLCKEKKGGFIYASNFSVGVNIFFELNKKLAELMGGQNQYSASMVEIHHTQKLDKPSGTAITLAEGIIEKSPYENWELDKSSNENSLEIKAERTPEIPGTHIINWESEVDDIKIEHKAHNRNGFAVGAVIASEWLLNKEGVYSMRDVLGMF